jgi:hypothetical protein
MEVLSKNRIEISFKVNTEFKVKKNTELNSNSVDFSQNVFGNLVYEPVQMEYIPLHFRKICLPMNTFPGSVLNGCDIKEEFRTRSIFEEWRHQYSTSENRKLYFGNNDVITISEPFSHCLNSSLQADATFPETVESSPFKLNLVINRRDLIRFSKLILFSYGVLIAIEHFERIPMANEALHIARIF